MNNLKGYKDCQKKYMDETMKEFKEKKLKISGKRIVKDRKQAVAIGLNTAQRKCKYTKNDYQLIKEKVKEFLYNDDRTISKKRVPLSNVIETRVLIEYYRNRKEIRKANKIKDDLLKRVIESGKDGIKITKNIFEEINKILI